MMCRASIVVYYLFIGYYWLLLSTVHRRLCRDRDMKTVECTADDAASSERLCLLLLLFIRSEALWYGGLRISQQAAHLLTHH